MSQLWASGSSRRRSVGDGTKDRRPRLKTLAAASAQERRRQEFITNQKQARRNLADHARLLAALPADESDSPDAQEDLPSTAGAPPWGHWDDEQDAMAIDAQAQEHAAGGEPGFDGGVSSSTGGGEGCASGTGANGSAAIGGKRGSRWGRGKREARGNGSGGGSSQRWAKSRDHWSKQLCTPEWMLTVPSDLNGSGSPVGAGWFVMARPEGKRVLLVSSKGETVARQLSGAVTHRFSSNLPGGSASGRRGGVKGGGYCILDCVFHELDQTFLVLDMMAWKGYPLYDCNTDFRLYWVRTKLLEADGPLDVVTTRNAYRIKPTPYHECDRQGLAHAYSSPVPYIRDGLLFQLKAAHYQLGPTPLVLLWKDASVARYLGNEGAQAVVLRVGDRHSQESEDLQGGATGACSAALPAGSALVAVDGGSAAGVGVGLPLMTSDGVCLGDVGVEGTATYAPQAKLNDLLRFRLTGAEEELTDQSADSMGGGEWPRGIAHGLRFEKRCSVMRPMADTWSKVLFQARLRHESGISIEDIDAKCAASTPSATGLPPAKHLGQGAGLENDDDML